MAGSQKRRNISGNQTGMSTSKHAERMLEVPEMTRPSKAGDALARTRAVYRDESHGLGSKPDAGSRMASALVDKTAERLAFERSGVRLYDALLDKLGTSTSFKGGPTGQQVQSIRDEELAHARMLEQALEALGADPTMVTPSADLVAVEGMGLAAVLGDPRTTVGQCLHALMVAELADGEGWTMLRTLAEESNQSNLAGEFAAAERQEARHEELVRAWLTAHARVEAGLA